ncbi:GNAT family N-acetyltransferase [Meridianimarinicoccus aquatilis]|uniref:GNAT family N-acetyltransferase n=2 Tax=Meridianimarinicoccus aquatilis TaxID=2552766 RepID=A0A4R6AQI1_9RHOB|nr:GNAT family N-acetyltransferase [Fluviibacterium aquatile]
MNLLSQTRPAKKRQFAFIEASKLGQALFHVATGQPFTMTSIRPFKAQDADILQHVFYRAVQEGAVGAYSVAERAAWASAPNAPPNWAQRLGSEITLVAERDGQPAGFITLGRDGHVDLLFVLPEEMGSGIAAALHDRMLSEADQRDIPRLTTEASVIARRFLLKQGWRELTEQKIELGGVWLTNYRMEKRLTPRSVG